MAKLVIPTEDVPSLISMPNDLALVRNSSSKLESAIGPPKPKSANFTTRRDGTSAYGELASILSCATLESIMLFRPIDL
eukprot:CAMPEP_0185822680 /NCGR_PEP_ID=MMETSP1322-20130828/27071_1 /TAXON_ID=265543 /ORGANISM="Minutocellus polymorphus, Strain RCC2270" /LENGTH=78 /DNA_ID=CAMNT_0028520171 /DNA_START=201 /DNA_END=437 /DNA_ORIENTATION=-